MQGDKVLLGPPSCERSYKNHTSSHESRQAPAARLQAAVPRRCAPWLIRGLNSLCVPHRTHFRAYPDTDIHEHASLGQEAQEHEAQAPVFYRLSQLPH